VENLSANTQTKAAGNCGFFVERHDCVTSTNQIVKAAIDALVGTSNNVNQGAEGVTSQAKAALESGLDLAIFAREQCSGYGRQGRAWVSPRGGMYASFLLRPNIGTAELPTLSLVCALAVRAAVLEIVGNTGEVAHNVCVKWPNDVVVRAGATASSAQGATFNKLAGISLELHRGVVCVGIGINVYPPVDAQTQAPAQPSAQTQATPKNTPAYLCNLLMPAATGGATNKDALVSDTFGILLRHLRGHYDAWQTGTFAAMAPEFNAANVLTGQRVSVANIAGEVTHTGRVTCVNANGTLQIITNTGAPINISSGEAHLV
jgi:BirA family biotin operon repressor/biotin-[acetyl-CoA-carboxylase] ligase